MNTAAAHSVSPARLLGLGGTTLLGILFFGVGMGLSMALVSVNARLSPGLPWFPLPVLALTAGMTLWAGRRWDIGLFRQPAGPAVRTWGLALAVTVLGVSLCILQGAGFGMVREAETVAGVDSAAFQFAYGLTLGFVAAILAEVTFRGLLQTRFEAVLGPWPAILVVAAINTAAHRWGPDLAAQWAAYFVSLAGLGYLRVATGSLVPPLAAHGAANILLGLTLWFAGPLDQGNLLTAGGGLGVVGVSLLAAAGLAASVALGRGPRART